jgi:hypothetical protein
MVDIEYAGELSGSYVCLNREFREQMQVLKTVQDKRI